MLMPDAVSVASMVAMPLKPPSKSPLKPIFIIDALISRFCFFFYLEKTTDPVMPWTSVSPLSSAYHLEKTSDTVMPWTGVCLFE